MAAFFEPTAADFGAARARIAPHVVQTPLLRAEGLERGVGRVFLKPENLQRGGAFKARGAFNAVLSLSKAGRERGVVAFSSGNHATAVALAARDIGMLEQGTAYPCTVVMPADAVRQKVARVRELGAEIVFFGNSVADRQAHAEELGHARGQAVIPSYDLPTVICGQGTLGGEILEQWTALRRPALGLVATPVGGGGMLAGTATALRLNGYWGRIAGVEPESANDTALSFSAGARVAIPLSTTICDGLRSTTPGALTFPLVRRHVNAIATVSDAAVRVAVQWLLDEMKLLAEPSGAVCIAAWQTGALKAEEGDVVLVVSGGNGSVPV